MANEENKEVKVEAKAKVDEKPANAKPTDKKEEKKGDRRHDRRPHFEEKKEFEERIVEINRISKTVQGGRHMRFSALAVIGDMKGRYGFAMEKSGEVPDAMKKAVGAARHNMYRIHIVHGRKGGPDNATIAHEVLGKYGATKVYLKPAPAGTGIIAGGPVRAILELAGLKNVVSKVYGARASINVIRATHNAISQLKSYREVQTLRGKFEAKEKEEKEEAK
ncbi:MAG: 30S ribosomal protein S5 [Bacilli bacterium]|nr:30S ribosomal protein S5 [Bacilli bacterium]